MAWIRVGFAAGLASCFVYPALIFLPLPYAVSAALVAAWGPLLGLGSYGLGRLLQVERPSWLSQGGVLLNFAAGALVTAMLLVQIAIRHEPTAAVPRQIHWR